jgi:hypothetical protein
MGRWNDTFLYLVAMLLAIILGFYAYSAKAAEPDQQADKIVYRKKMTIDFSDVTIKGELTKPEGAYLGVRKNIKFKNFIKIRSSFRDKISDSSDNI